MDLAIYTLRSLAYAIVDPQYALILTLLAVMFYMQNRKNAFMQRMILGESFNSPLELTLSQIVLGILAGALGSIILTYLGVVFDKNSGIGILFMVSLLLMFYKPRFFCFSYSAALLGIVTIILNSIYASMNMESPLNINVVSLITFVGVLHIIEGILVSFDGDRGAIPVFTNKDGRILGGFALKRHWAIPLALIILMKGTIDTGTVEIANPSWWPLIQGESFKKIMETAVISLVPFYGVIGYSSVTFTSNKKEKVRGSGVGIFLYGLIMILVGQLGDLGLVFQVVGLVLMPLAHEVMLKYQNVLEQRKEPVFVSDEEGISILDVSPNSPAQSAGVKSGDKILAINEEKVVNELHAYKLIKESYLTVDMKIKNRKGSIKNILINQVENKRLGVILVPKVVNDKDMINYDKQSFNDILDKLKNKDK
ncbi:PDZ domain-containing protein [Clostridium manihotivorum]|uniref:Signal protein PDZ n=1 Tax=Clostridium manihotivorum TaxID=2320868 RepID=A0A3R5QY56_9CLOT|nr:PDZ domain-containing protein [Clostridium manihotivorum]QAA34988.1 signal protein PDZ [Clostridium manihotivorum]